MQQVFNRNDVSILEATQKVVIFGGGSFGTAVGAALARQKADLDVTMLLRDPYVCQDINTLHRNRRYLDVRFWPPARRSSHEFLAAPNGSLPA